MKTLLLSSALLMTIVTCVSAQDLGSGAGGPLAYEWTGFYFGAQGGFARGDVDHVGLTSPATSRVAAQYDLDGYALGLHAGYNSQSGSWVHGIEGDAEFFNIDARSASLLVNGVVNNTIGAKTDFDWIGSLRARVGYAHDETLFYSTAGIAFANQRNGYYGAVTMDYSDKLIGWTAGAGIEHAFGERIRARLEYRYTDLGAAKGTLYSGIIPIYTEVNVELHTVRAGISIALQPAMNPFQ